MTETRQTPRQPPLFAEDAAQAFGKKVTREFVEPSAFQNRQTRDNFDENAMNAFGKKYKGPREEPVVEESGDWTGSALRRVTKPIVKIDEEEQFPALGSKKSNEKTTSVKGAKPVSFVSLVKKLAEEDAIEAERKAEAEKRSLEAARKRKEENDRYKQRSSISIKKKLQQFPLEPDDVDEDSIAGEFAHDDDEDDVEVEQDDSRYDED
jgi:hypothetical protein